jgi:S-adenosylmethionine synthetase
MQLASRDLKDRPTLVVEDLRTTPVAQRRIELVERKGIGHPDTICCPALLEIYVHLSARIGEPVGTPWTGVQIVLPPGMGIADVEGMIRDVVEAEVARMPQFREELIRGEHPVC